VLKIIPVERDSAMQMLDDGELDLVIAGFAEWPKRIKSVGLYTERFVAVARRGHPGFAEGQPSLRSFLELPHMRVSFLTGSRDRFDGALAERNLRRRVVITSPNFAVVPYIVQNSDLVAVTGERIARHFAERMGVAIHPIPLRLAPWMMRLFWA